MLQKQISVAFWLLSLVFDYFSMNRGAGFLKKNAGNVSTASVNDLQAAEWKSHNKPNSSTIFHNNK